MIGFVCAVSTTIRLRRRIHRANSIKLNVLFMSMRSTPNQINKNPISISQHGLGRKKTNKKKRTNSQPDDADMQMRVSSGVGNSVKLGKPLGNHEYANEMDPI